MTDPWQHITLRAPAELINGLDALALENGYENKAQFLRALIRGANTEVCDFTKALGNACQFDPLAPDEKPPALDRQARRVERDQASFFLLGNYRMRLDDGNPRPRHHRLLDGLVRPHFDGAVGPAPIRRWISSPST